MTSASAGLSPFCQMDIPRNGLDETVREVLRAIPVARFDWIRRHFGPLVKLARDVCCDLWGHSWGFLKMRHHDHAVDLAAQESVQQFRVILEWTQPNDCPLGPSIRDPVDRLKVDGKHAVARGRRSGYSQLSAAQQAVSECSAI